MRHEKHSSSKTFQWLEFWREQHVLFQRRSNHRKCVRFCGFTHCPDVSVCHEQPQLRGEKKCGLLNKTDWSFANPFFWQMYLMHKCTCRKTLFFFCSEFDGSNMFQTSQLNRRLGKLLNAPMKHLVNWLRWRFHVCAWTTDLSRIPPFKPKDNTRFSTLQNTWLCKGCYYVGSGTLNDRILHLLTVDTALAHFLCAVYAIISKGYNIAQSHTAAHCPSDVSDEASVSGTSRLL